MFDRLDQIEARYDELTQTLATTGWISEGYVQDRGPGAGGPCARVRLHELAEQAHRIGRRHGVRVRRRDGFQHRDVDAAGQPHLEPVAERALPRCQRTPVSTASLAKRVPQPGSGSWEALADSHETPLG
jgi:hypothetical protein